jgi:hypothetical protein
MAYGLTKFTHSIIWHCKSSMFSMLIYCNFALMSDITYQNALKYIQKLTTIQYVPSNSQLNYHLDCSLFSLVEQIGEGRQEELILPRAVQLERVLYPVEDSMVGWYLQAGQVSVPHRRRELHAGHVSRCRSCSDLLQWRQRRCRQRDRGVWFLLGFHGCVVAIFGWRGRGWNEEAVVRRQVVVCGGRGDPNQQCPGHVVHIAASLPLLHFRGSLFQLLQWSGLPVDLAQHHVLLQPSKTVRSSYSLII